MAKTLAEKYFDEKFDSVIDTLSRIIANGFDETNGRVDKLDHRIDKLETKIDIIDGKLDNVLYKEVNQLDTRVTKIEKHLGLKTA